MCDPLVVYWKIIAAQLDVLSHNFKGGNEILKYGFPALINWKLELTDEKQILAQSRQKTQLLFEPEEG